MGKYVCKSENDLPEIGRELLNVHNGKNVFAFVGPMGVGKTTFIKEICRLLGVEDIVASPTFSIINEYKTKNHKILFHLDLYRVSVNEVLNLGYEEYLFGNNYCFIEWADKIEQLLPDSTVTVRMNEKDKQRIITF